MWVKGIFVFVAFFGLASAQTRIVNGTDSDIHKFPFIVSLRSRTGSHSCGGSIIAPKWILTAGHCVAGRTAKNMTIQYGVTKIGNGGPNIAQVKRFILHENYDAENITDDVALLELHGRIVYNYKTIAPVNLPEYNFEVKQLAVGEPGILIGWGRNATAGPVQKVLQEVNLKIYSDAECAERHGNDVSSNNICGGVDEGWKGQCSGDSGGPLLYNNNIQVGIVSWSRKPCGRPPYPGVFTKVSHYIDWIEKNMSV